MRARPWPLSLAAREGLLNAVAGRWLPALMILATAVVTAGAGLSNAFDVSRLASAEADWIDAGGYTYVVEPGGNGDSATVDVSSCERLRDVEGINGAFALTVTDETAWPSNAPGTSSTFAQASLGVYDFFGLAAPHTAGVIVTPSVAESTGLADGELTDMSVSRHDGSIVRREARVEVVALDTQSLPEALAGTYLSTELVGGEAQQCYVETDAAHDDAVRGYLAAALASGDEPANVRPRLSKNTYGVDFATAYDTRPLGWAWVAGAVFLAALWAIVRWTRRSRLAIYATFGADARARLVMQMSEWTALTGLGAIWGWAIGVCFALAMGSDAQIAVTQVSGQAAASWCLASVVATLIALAPVGTLIDALKDRT